MAVEFLTAKVVENKQWNDRLHSLRVDADFPDFKAGQFARLALDIDGELIARPFSLVNAPYEKLLDFYLIEIPDGVLSPRLAAMKPGDEIKIAPKAAGLLTLDQIPAAKHLYLISTGTGLGPFLSIIKTDEVWQQFEKVVLVHGVRFANELTYQELIADVKQQHNEQFEYLPFVSREKTDEAIEGRVTKAIKDGFFEERTGLTFSAEDSHVMLCGNPDMVQEMMDILITDHGLQKHSKREPGQISIEKYW
ncbi:MAG TPA: ferredoxin--NADP reductase [Methylophaga aminisulfidivorans]|uniref:ferredoxin--NADP(+) reductase n=2 Tax=root TaxID=1 RepID=A0A7C1ZPQ0_9GAMM|nr:ferredoxin--NADP reductase [Methylophaga aminisulfidivorans]